MWRSLRNFILYNNTFVVGVLVLLFAGSSVFAATNPDVRAAFISSEEKLVAIDNSYLLSVDLEEYDFKVKITKVEKDDQNYYVAYQFQTIELFDGVWQNIVKNDVLTINIEQLGDRDLGLYAAEELKELVAFTESRLKATQLDEEKSGPSNKTIARTYRGMVGRFLESDEVTFRGYDPVIEPVVVQASQSQQTTESRASVSLGTVIVGPEPTTNSGIGETTTTSPDTSVVPPTSSTTPQSDSAPPVITLNGDASIELDLGDSYEEQGATANDGVDGDISEQIRIEGTVQTETEGVYTLRYIVEDSAMNQSEAQRTVTIISPTEPEEVLQNSESTQTETTENIEPIENVQ